MRRGLQTSASSGWVRGPGRAGERGQDERAPGRLAEPARSVAAGSQAPVGTAAASRQVRAALTPPPLTLSRSPLLPRETSVGSPRQYFQPVSGCSQAARSRTQERRAPAGRPLLCARFPLFALLLRLLRHLRPHQLQLCETPHSRGQRSQPGVTHGSGAPAHT